MRWMMTRVRHRTSAIVHALGAGAVRSPEQLPTPPAGRTTAALPRRPRRRHPPRMHVIRAMRSYHKQGSPTRGRPPCKPLCGRTNPSAEGQRACRGRDARGVGASGRTWRGATPKAAYAATASWSAAVRAWAASYLGRPLARLTETCSTQEPWRLSHAPPHALSLRAPQVPHLPPHRRLVPPSLRSFPTVAPRAGCRRGGRAGWRRGESRARVCKSTRATEHSDVTHGPCTCGDAQGIITRERCSPHPGQTRHPAMQNVRDDRSGHVSRVRRG